MIVKPQSVSIEITRRNISYYKKQGYNDVKIGDILNIGVDCLSKGSKTKVAVKCDYCGDIIMVAYKDYMNYKFDKYSCPSGYVLSGNECVKVVNKTCSKTCSSEIWSEWSNWSTTKVIENINVQVQTKVQ